MHNDNIGHLRMIVFAYVTDVFCFFILFVDENIHYTEQEIIE